MNKSTTLLSFPDVNVWLALLHADHVHRAPASRWWQRAEGRIAFTRFTEISLLRLLTTSAAMKHQPLTMDDAWRAYERLFEDDRVAFYAEPAEVEKHFRKYASGLTASPKLWADAWLLAVAQAAEGTLITFDRALGARGARCLLAESGDDT
jgi:toxin-antitoxin system PIN domain toxin